jgi:hypothetical protein
MILLAPPAVRALFTLATPISGRGTSFALHYAYYPHSKAVGYAWDALADEMAAYAAARTAYTFVYNEDDLADRELVRAVRASPPPVSCLFALSKSLPVGVPCTLYDNGVPTCGAAAREAVYRTLRTEMQRAFPHGCSGEHDVILVCTRAAAEMMPEVGIIRASAALSAKCLIGLYADTYAEEARMATLYKRTSSGVFWVVSHCITFADARGALQRFIDAQTTAVATAPAAVAAAVATAPAAVAAAVATAPADAPAANVPAVAADVSAVAAAVPAPVAATPILDAARKMLRKSLATARWTVCIDNSNPADMAFLAAVPAEWLQTVDCKLVQDARYRAEVRDTVSKISMTKTELLELMAFVAARS